MTFDSTTLLVAAVFASQILVLSCICPWRLYRAWLRMRVIYPPGAYPRLYPIAAEKTARQNTIFQGMHIVIGVAAAGVLAFNLVRGTDARHLAVTMVWVYMIQLLPALLRLPLQIRMYRAFRAMPAPAVRSAELHHWRVTDFVTPTEVVLGISASLLALGSSAWFYFRGPPNILTLLIYSAAISCLLLLRMALLLAGSVTLRRPDPYMSEEDVIRGRKFRLTLPFRMAILLGLYFIFMQLYAAGKLRVDFSYVMAFASILGQLVYLRFTHLALRSQAARNLSAYRNDAADTKKGGQHGLLDENSTI